ncbi:MAG: hypothetical protein J0I18_04990 [Actinobacteria bacterium]|nr:hypothetical protein [Actinomycetota bacterium]
MTSPHSIVRFVGLDPRAFFAPLPAPPDALDTTVTLWAGIDEVELGAEREAVRAEIRDTVDEVLSDPHLAAAAHALPIRAGQRIVVLGDSLSAEAGSWADLFAEVLHRLRPGATVLNWSLAGRTTAETVAALAPVVAHRPDWVITMIGTNDVRRHGVGSGVRMASASAIAHSRGALRERLRTETAAQLITLTPPPINPDTVTANRSTGVWWELADIDAAVEAARADDTPTIDVHATVRTGTGFWGPDGIHPTRSGQRAILTAVLDGFSRADRARE